MLGPIAGIITGFLLAHNGYEYTDGIYWAVLVPTCIAACGVQYQFFPRR